MECGWSIQEYYIRQMKIQPPRTLVLASTLYGDAGGRTEKLSFKNVSQFRRLTPTPLFPHDARGVRLSMPWVGKKIMDQKPATLQQFDGIRILVVEDELINQMVCQKVLEKMGIEVGVAENGQQAIDALASDHFDLVLMDCQMPVMDGYEATRAIRASEQVGNLPRLPIIALTAHAMRGDREVCIEAGMDDYLSKPFVIAELQKILQRILPEIS